MRALQLPRTHPDYRLREFTKLFASNNHAVDEFEKALTALAQKNFGFLFPYGRTAIFAMLKGLQFSNEAIAIPAYTCISVADAVVASGNRPVFVDVKSDSLTMDVDQLPSDEDIRAAIPTNIYGAPADVRALRDRLGNSVFLIEDACLSLFSNHNTQDADVTIFSFALGKELCTFGGGFIATNRSDLAEVLEAIRAELIADGSRSFINKKLALLLSYFIYGRLTYPLAYRVYKLHPGLTRFRMKSRVTTGEFPADYDAPYTGFQADLGLSKLSRITQTLANIRKIIGIYNEMLQDVEGVLLPDPTTVCSHYTVRIRNRAAFLERLCQVGVKLNPSMDYDYVVPHTAPYRKWSNSQTFPVAEAAAREVVNLPLHPRLRESDQRVICEGIRQALAG
jgi:dTDP-4-amino-4,6-dideoxygalactose transaminase